MDAVERKQGHCIWCGSSPDETHKPDCYIRPAAKVQPAAPTPTVHVNCCGLYPGKDTCPKCPKMPPIEPRKVLEEVDMTVPPPSSDMVFRPHHYARFIIEPATFIGANKLPYDVGAIIKYVCRYDAKNGLEDIRKAIRFCEMLEERVLREGRIAAGEDANDVWKETL